MDKFKRNERLAVIFFFNDAAATESYTPALVGRVRCA